MDLRKLKTLIDLVAESGIAELEITEGEDKVKIVKSNAGPQTSHVSHVYTAPTSAAPATQSSAAPVAEAAAPVSAAASAPEGKVIKSPMVGTFYRASSPGAEPFVSVGSTVSRGADAVRDRGDEADERDPRRCGWRDQRGTGRKRPARGVWSAPVRAGLDIRSSPPIR